MDNDKLYIILDFILNQAEVKELDVIDAAVKKRYKNLESKGPMGINPEKMAMEVASGISSQVDYSVDQIRDLVKEYARKILHKNAPELTKDQLDELLSAWVSDPAASSEPDNILPADLLITMIKQFIEYSSGTMSPSEQVKLKKEMGDWPQKYWNKFPSMIKKLISLYLKESLDSDTFWASVCSELNIEI